MKLKEVLDELEVIAATGGGKGFIEGAGAFGGLSGDWVKETAAPKDRQCNSCNTQFYEIYGRHDRKVTIPDPESLISVQPIPGA